MSIFVDTTMMTSQTNASQHRIKAPPVDEEAVAATMKKANDSLSTNELRKGLSNQRDSASRERSPSKSDLKEDASRRKRTKQLGEVFVAFDLDSDGVISVKELDALARMKRDIQGKEAWSEQKNLALFAKVDRDASGGIDKKARALACHCCGSRSALRVNIPHARISPYTILSNHKHSLSFLLAGVLPLFFERVVRRYGAHVGGGL